jgi:hypothetical protein
MAFFRDGRLRGIFTPGPGNAPLALDKWAATWVDRDWLANAGSGAPRPAGPR